MAEEDCPTCRLAVGVGMVINICKDNDIGIDCDRLLKDMIDEKIRPGDAIALIKSKVDGKAKSKIEFIEGLMK